MFVVVENNRSVATRPPGSVSGAKKQKTALIKEDKVAPICFEFFLAQATCSVSNIRWPFHHAGALAAPELGSSIDSAGEVARCGWDDTILEIPSV